VNSPLVSRCPGECPSEQSSGVLCPRTLYNQDMFLLWIGLGAINNNVGSKEVFECSQCNLKTGRDMNASKNIKMKGFFC
jgi:transposase